MAGSRACHRPLRGLAGALALVALLSPAGVRAMGTCGSKGVTGEQKRVTFDPSYYYVWAPADQSKPHPMLLVLHGDEGNPDGMVGLWDPVWRRDPSFIMVIPQAPYAMGSWWNAPYDHAKFIDKLLAEIAAKYNVDTDRIYTTGVSGGPTFLEYYGLRRQNVFAAMQFSCGGAWSTDDPWYADPPRSDCKIPVRFVISMTDKLYDLVKSVYDGLKSKGHEVDFYLAPCSGHCCGPLDQYSTVAAAWLFKHTKCGSVSADGCGMITDLPPMAGSSPDPTPDGASADGGMAEDGASDGEPPGDGGAVGAEPPAPSKSGGCDCSTGERGAPALAGLPLALAALAARSRRRFTKISLPRRRAGARGASSPTARSSPSAPGG